MEVEETSAVHAWRICPTAKAKRAVLSYRSLAACSSLSTKVISEFLLFALGFFFCSQVVGDWEGLCGFVGISGAKCQVFCVQF